MVAAVVALILLMVLIILAVRLIGAKTRPGEEIDGAHDDSPVIQTSGIYSIIRKSPRQDLLAIRPDEAQVRKYLTSINEDIQGRSLAISDKEKLAEAWQRSMEESIRTIEQDDAQSTLFYYFDSAGQEECPECAMYFKRGQFVTREQIFANAAIIPPFHLGCTTNKSISW